MKQGFTVGAIIGSALLASAATFVAVRVGAAGIPAKGSLTYTGYLEGENGTAVTTEQMIGLAAYDNSTAGTKVCEVETKPITPAGGRFQIQLPDTCVAAVSANSELWVEVYVAGIGLGRTKLGAVPYAVEAGHADHATSASAAAGTLADRIARLEQDLVGVQNALRPRSSGWCYKTTPDLWGFDERKVVKEMRNVGGGGYFIQFDVCTLNAIELLDDKYTIKVEESGYYIASCGAWTNDSYDANTQRGVLLLHLMVSGKVAAASSSDDFALNVTSAVSLNAGDTISCLLKTWYGNVTSVVTTNPWQQTANYVSVARLSP